MQTSVSIATVSCQKMLLLENKLEHPFISFNAFVREQENDDGIVYCKYLGPLRKVFSLLASAAVRLALESAVIGKLSSSAIKVLRYGFSTPEHISLFLEK